MKEKVLVTGGFGFIGINLILRLLRTTSYSVIVACRTTHNKIPKEILGSKRVTFAYSNLLNEKSIDALVKKCTIVIHLASSAIQPSSSDESVLMMGNNINGALNILSSAQRHNIKKIIMLSSGGVYGNQKKNEKIDESHSLLPLNPYTSSKLIVDILCNSFFTSFGTPVVTLRPFNVYGPHQSIHRVIPIFITKLLANQSVILNHGGTQKRDFIYVDDLVDLILLVMANSDKSILGEVYNVCSGKGVPLLRLADIIVQKLGKNKALIRIPKSSKTEAMCSVGSNMKAEVRFGWKPKTSLNEGLEKTINWYKNNRRKNES